MTVPLRAAARARSILGAALALVLVACGSAPHPSTRPSAAASAAAAAPSLTPVPGGSTLPASGASSGTPTTSEVDGFGTIWDALPASFPKLVGMIPADEAKPASGLFAAIMGDAAEASTSMREALRAQGWRVDVGSPLEDGTVVVDATGPTSGCRAEIRFTPVSGSLIMEVLYGASCPFE